MEVGSKVLCREDGWVGYVEYASKEDDTVTVRCQDGFTRGYRWEDPTLILLSPPETEWRAVPPEYYAEAEEILWSCRDIWCDAWAQVQNAGPKCNRDVPVMSTKILSVYGRWGML